ncbi:MAG: MFS transporter, partial [Candidatus Moranbacteria bacterium]|nr:MFS transporter [Candidatus Moranbacteria bacterium]
MHRYLQHRKYLSKRFPKGLKALFANYIIIDLASGLFAVFLPIFLYEFLNKDLQAVFIYYLLGYLLTLLIIIMGSQKLNKFGFRRALKASTFFAVFFYASLYFLNHDNLEYLIPFSIVFLAIRRFLYWIPYNIDFAKFADSQDRGKTMGLLEIILSITGVVTPLVAGFIIVKFGFNALFLLGVIIFIISYFPLISLPRTKEKFSWNALKTIEKILDKKNRTTVLIFFAEGAESIIFFIIWPIFVFQILQGNYLQVGFISTATVVVVVVAQFFVGKKADGTKK